MKVELSKKQYFKVFLQIFLVVSMAITTSWMINEVNKDILDNDGNGFVDNLILLVSFIGRVIFGNKGIASALAPSDLQEGTYTCLESKDGIYCQPYLASRCNDNCKSECIPSTRDSISKCSIGTCYNPIEGTCSAGSPKALCEGESGRWFDDPYENINECREGCCVLGDQASFVTEQECKRKSQLLGRAKNFSASIRTELGCLQLSKTQEEGACVFEENDEKTCSVETKANCLRLHGEFNSRILCSNPVLNNGTAICQPQKTTGCVKDRDEIYWFDSCGNRENIYDANNKINLRNVLVPKDQSCSLGTSSDPFSNQKTCGNCNYLLGSICGLKTINEKLGDDEQNVVCEDVRCDTNRDGIKDKDNGESWCEYQGAIGVDEGSGVDKDKNPLTRSIDTPGSRHFRKVCINGEVKTEPCADYRNEICVQADTKTTGSNTFSSAACRLNRWQQCLSYNTEIKNDNNLGGITPDQRDNKCTKNPDCVIKNVNVDKKGFNFNMCVPKYPEGFDLNTNSDAAQNICAFASQKCTEVWVKDMGGSWDCKANCKCHTKVFSEQMNDLCISLGDCGTKANYEGDLTYNSKVFKSSSAKELGKDVTLTGKGWFSAAYINELKAYADYSKSPNKYADPGNIADFYGSLGIPNELGVGVFSDSSAGAQGFGTMVGMGGMVLAMGVNAVVPAAGVSSSIASTLGPGVTAAGGALAGAAIGFAAVGMLIQFTGIGPALGEEGA